MSDCNADLDHPCDADCGSPCASCRVSIEEGMREAAATYHMRPMSPEDYRAMIDAGRGHLLRPDEM